MPNDGRCLDALGDRFVAVGGGFVCGDIGGMKLLLFFIGYIVVNYLGSAYLWFMLDRDDRSKKVVWLYWTLFVMIWSLVWFYFCTLLVHDLGLL